MKKLMILMVLVLFFGVISCIEFPEQPYEVILVDNNYFEAPFYVGYEKGVGTALEIKFGFVKFASSYEVYGMYYATDQIIKIKQFNANDLLIILSESHENISYLKLSESEYMQNPIEIGFNEKDKKPKKIGVRAISVDGIASKIIWSNNITLW